MTPPDHAMRYSLPASWYRDPAIYARERTAVFGAAWQPIAHESQMPAPGDYVADAIAGYRVFAIRGRDGAARAFHNVCRHRAGPLVDNGAGHCDALRCRYHGWLYDQDGRLRRTPDFGAADGVDADGFDRDRFGLFRLAVEHWQGFIFINLDPRAPPLAQAWGALTARVEALGVGDLTFSDARSHELRCNWKTYVENYLEGYHIPYVHPALNREVDMASYRVETDDGCVIHHAQPRADAGAAVYDGLWAWTPPNLAFNVYDAGMSLERMTPSGVGTMRIDYWFLYREHASGAERAAAAALSREVTNEDIEICEAVQSGLDAGVYDRGPLSPRHEAGVAWFQDHVRARLGADDAELAP